MSSIQGFKVSLKFLYNNCYVPWQQLYLKLSKSLRETNFGEVALPTTLHQFLERTYDQRNLYRSLHLIKSSTKNIPSNRTIIYRYLRV